MMCGAACWKYLLVELVVVCWLSSRLPGIDMAGAQDGSWGSHHLALLRLATMLSHVGVMWLG
jgi:hypothetical protein